ncbi:MAG: TonB-dependent receptor plug domain-containing protein [Gammaproteobacteria bacterium]
MFRLLLGFATFLYLQFHLPIIFADEALSVSQLKAMSLDEILQVEVVSKKKENKYSAAGIVSVVTRDEIDRYGGNTLADVLNRVTSVYLLSTYIWSNSTAAFRGDALTHVNNHTLVLINGRPIRDSAYGGLNETMFRDFPIHHIEQIEVIRGPGSVLYGSNAFTGVVNVVTKKHKENSFALRGRYGSFNTGQVESEFAWKNQQAAITGAIRYRGSDGWLSSQIDEELQRTTFRNDGVDLSASLWGEWQNFNFNLFVVNNQHNHWGSVPIGSGQAIENRKFFFDTGYKHQFADNWLATLNLSYTQFTQNYDLPVNKVLYLTDLYEDNILLEQTNYLKFFDDKLNITLGGLIIWEDGGVTQVANPNTLEPYSQIRSSIYGEASYPILDNLKLTLGGQFHYYDNLKKSPEGVLDNGKPTTGLVGRAGLVYEINPEWGIKLLYNQAYRAPSAGELGANSSLVLGNRNIQPERVDTVDAQIFYHSGSFQTSLTAFRSEVRNLIVRVAVPNTNPPRLQYNNSGSATFEGLEFEGDAKLSERLLFKGSYTFQTNSEQNGQNNATQMPNHMAKIGLSFDVTPDLQISAFDTYFSAAKVVPSSLVVNPPADSYHNISINTNYKLDHLLGFSSAKHITFSFYIDNLLDEKFYYPEFNRKKINTLPASPGRSLFGEIAINF